MRSTSTARASAILVLPLLALLLHASGARAQDAAVLVRVLSAGRPVVSASVQLFVGTRAARATATDASGVARFVGLRAGAYDVRAEIIGYRARTVEGVRVAAGEARVVEIELEQVPVEIEGLSVRADRIQIQRENTDFGTTVGDRALELLPVPYDPAELVALTPGARAEHVWGGANFQANSYQIDGLAANHPGLGGSLIEPSPLWVERVEVRGLGAGAEHGGFQGGQVNLVTKSGSNEFSGVLRTTLSTHALSGSNLLGSEIGSEVKDRYDLEGEVRGAIVPDRVFYYLGGSYVDRSARFLNHVDFSGRFSPLLEERSDGKVFGKLTWSPTPSDEIEMSGAFLGTRAENWGMTGYEGAGAASLFRAPTWFGDLGWRRTIGTGVVLEARVNHFERDERIDPYGGTDTPGVQLFSLLPPYTTFGNAPLTRRSAPSTTSASASGSFRFRTGGQEHLLELGAEYTRGGFLDRRTRNGGMTWTPVLQDGFDPGDPSTWPHAAEGFTPTEWGGEVHLDADVVNAAGYAQASLSLGRLVLAPGVRWSAWTGWLDPREGARFRAVSDRAVDPRVGATFGLSADRSWILKAHWGRYHQDLVAQMFDRAGGSDVFTNQETWYWRGPPPADPTRRYTEAERDALAAQGLFTRESVVHLNETGPVLDYHQPYVDQWLVGVQKQFGGSAQFEALYTRRTNHDMIALVDRNRATNYTRFERVRVHMGGAAGAPLPFAGGTVYMAELYIPNDVVREELRWCAANPDVCGPPPGMALADSLGLTWDPDYVLTNAPDATRTFGQLQLTFKFSRPRWGGSVSAVFTSLEGNLDDVTGYADPSEYGPGPYVRVNEGLNAYGTLPNFADREGKISAWGVLPWKLRGGGFLTLQSGDHYSPQFRISGQTSLYGYRANTHPRIPCNPRDQLCEDTSGGEALPSRFFGVLEGHDVFIGPRGAPEMRARANLDLRLERVFELSAFDLGVALDLFNVTGSKQVTEVQTMVNHGSRSYYFFDDVDTPFRRAWAGTWYKSPLERVSPRMVRLGMTAYF